MADASLPFLGEPPSRRPVRAADVPALRGKRVILSRPDGFVYDIRAVSEVYSDPSGKPRIDVCSEQAYYRWMLNGVRPETQAYPVSLVWVE
jgi:hypothetical protein